MRLKHKFILFSLLVILGPIIGLGLATTHLIDRAILGSEPQTLEHELKMAWVEYWGRGEQMRLGMVQAAAEPAVQDAIRVRDDVALRGLMRAWKATHTYADLWLVADPAGLIIARLDSERTGDSSPLNELLAAAIEQREPILSTEILSPETLAGEKLTVPSADGALAVAVAIPVPCDGSVCGVIATCDLVDSESYLPNRLRDKLHGPIAFISQHTTIVATSLQQAEASSVLSDFLPESVIAQVAAGTPYRGTVTIGGNPFLMATDPIHDGRGQVVGTLSVGLPAQLFWVLRREAVRAAIVSLLLGIVLSVAVAMRLDRRMARPVQDLTAKAQAIAAGDLSARVPTGGADEIGELSQAFNRMAQQLEESYGKVAEEQSKAITAIEASPDGIWISDANQRVVMVNPALERLTGRRRDELLGRPCRHLLEVHTLDGDSVCDKLCPFLDPDSDSGTVEGCITTESGKEVPIEISYGRLMDSQGRLAGLMHIVRDLTERKEVERVTDEVISMVSHELRTPLHHIKGFATTLLQTDVEWDAPTQRDFLESISRETDRLANLVEKILHLSRLESAALPMEKDWHQVSDLMKGALHWRHNLTGPVHLRVPPDLPTLFVDGREIEVVLINLIENAVKYSSPGTPITLGVERQGDQVVFSVADEGMGVPEEHLERIFEPFYRVDGVEPRLAGTGLGLGLAIAKRIVEAHGGRIWVETTPEVGSCFYFSLPVDGGQ
jgi:PAS domain S-box-containing protein